MRKYTIVLFSLISSFGIAQVQLTKQWVKNLGGSGSDICKSAIELGDTAFIAVGQSTSTEFGNKGSTDFMLTHVTKSGVVRYTNTFGSPTGEQQTCVGLLKNKTIVSGGFIIGKGGDVTTHHQGQDGWLICTDIKGKKLWDASYGGTNNDDIRDIYALETDNVFFAGGSRSIDKQIVSNKGDYDAIVGNISDLGALKSLRNIGGTKADRAFKMLPIANSKFIVIGETESSDGDFNGFAPNAKDIFIVQMNRMNNLERIVGVYGGPGDDVFVDAIGFTDGSFVIASTISEFGIDVPQGYGLKDIWLLKMDKDYNVRWSKVIGGTLNDVAVKLKRSGDQSFFVLGNTESKDGLITANYGRQDLWLAKIDERGEILWQQNYGGREGDLSGSLIVWDSLNLVSIGQSFSKDRDLDASNTQPADFWIQSIHACNSAVKTVEFKVCETDSLFIHNKWYHSGNTSGVDTLKAQASFACDSIVHVNIDVVRSVDYQLNDSLCYDQNLRVGNTIYNISNPEGTSIIKQRLAPFCDSIIDVKLSFFGPIEIQDIKVSDDFGGSNGSIELSVKNGIGPYKFKWDTGDSTATITNLKFGRYQCIVTDQLGCSKSFFFDVRNKTAVNNPIADLVNFINHKGSIIVKLDPTLIGATIQIFDFQGKEYVTKKLAGEFTGIIMNRSGVYVCKIVHESEVFTMKLYVGE